MINAKYLLILLFTTLVTAQNKATYNNWESHLTEGVNLLQNGSFEAAQHELRMSYGLALKLFDKNTQEFSSTAFYLGIIEFQLENYQECTVPFEHSVLYYRNQNLKTEEIYLQIINYLAIAYSETNQLKLAEQQYQELLEIARQTMGTESIDYGIILTNVASFYTKTQDFNSALENYNQGMAILNNFKEFPEDYKRNLKFNNIPFIYEGLGRFNEAIAIQKEALKYTIDTMGQMSVNTANILAHLGNLYLNSGDFENSEKNLLAAVNIFERLNDPDLEAYGNAQMGLSKLQLIKSDYPKALEYAMLGLENSGYNAGKNPKNILNYLEIIAELYQNIGQYQNAIHYYEKAVAQAEKEMGSLSIPFLKNQANLGVLHYQYGDIDEGKYLLENSFKTVTSNFKEDEEVYWYVSYLFLPVLVDTNEFQKGIDIIQKIILNTSKNSLSYFTYQTTLAELYLINKECNNALEILQTIEPGLKNIYDDNHEKTIHFHHLKIKSHHCAGNYNSLPKLIDNNSRRIKYRLQNLFEFGSEYDKEAYLNTVQLYFDFYQSLNFDNNISQNIHQTNLNNHLLIKGILLESSKNVVQRLTNINDADVKADLKIYWETKEKISKLNNSSSTNDAGQISQLYGQQMFYETQLNKHYQNHFTSDFDWNYSWTSIRDQLQTHEAAIDFVKYESGNSGNTQIKYLAFIIDKEQNEPQIVELFTEDDFYKHISNHQKPSQLYASRGSISRSTLKVNNSFLYENIWKPILSKIKDKTTLFISADGVLHQISHAAIRDDNNEFLLNKYDIQWFNNLKNISKAQILNPRNILLFGGIQYKTESVSKSSDYWEFLPGTLKEVNTIYNYFDEQFKQVSIYTGNDASESIFRREAEKSYHIIHIATHGFFFEKHDTSSVNNLFQTSSNAMIRSGLVFANANNYWDNQSNNNDNGVLTADEISNLQLPDTKLVVLSACETGLGDVVGNEGVYGLQRAFKTAGAQHLLISLWKVPDEETTQFMTLFYKNLLETNFVNKAFLKTQKQMQQTYPDEPVKWAAFVLVN